MEKGAIWLSRQAVQSPHRKNSHYRPDNEKVNPYVRFRRHGQNEPLPSRIKPPGKGRDEERPESSPNAGCKELRHKVSRQKNHSYRKDVERFADEQ